MPFHFVRSRYRRQKLITLPAAPKNASPVPWLTSIHSTRRRGPYGDARYRGNCRDLGIACHSFDLRSGADAQDAASYQELGRFDFIWLHPPYWRMITYNDDPRCLSNAESLTEKEASGNGWPRRFHRIRKLFS